MYFLIFTCWYSLVTGTISNNQGPNIIQYTPCSLGSVLGNMISVDNIIPVSSEYQEIHPCSALNIDSVKINTSLIMVKEWLIAVSFSISHCFGFASNPLLDFLPFNWIIFSSTHALFLHLFPDHFFWLLSWNLFQVIIMATLQWKRY